MNLLRASALVLVATVCLGACSRREYVPFEQQGLLSGMTKTEAIAAVRAIGFKVKSDSKLDERYSMVDATFGEQLWILGFCNDRLALSSSLVPTNRERMDKLLASYTHAYGKPREEIATRDRSQPQTTDDFLKHAIFGPRNDVTLTWRTPYGTAIAQFDHGADSLSLELKDTRVWQPCAPANR